MSDHFELERWKGIQGDSQEWYEGVHPLGPGKNAMTFLAVGTSGLNKGVLFAIKVFRRISTPKAKNKFLAEVKLLRAISHPGIMRVFDEGTYYTHHPFVVAEYLPNTLRDIIKEDCSITEKLTYAIQMLSVLRFLEGQKPKVVHRDLKPDNIFVKGRSCVIGDFGLMKLSGVDEDDDDRKMIKISQGPGMPLRYRTPELVKYLRREPVVIARSDVFQLGLVLAELFTGENPQQEANDYMDDIVLNRIPHIPGEIGAGIFSLLTRMLAISPDERPTIDSLLDSWMAIFKGAVTNTAYLNDTIF